MCLKILLLQCYFFILFIYCSCFCTILSLFCNFRKFRHILKKITFSDEKKIVIFLLHFEYFIYHTYMQIQLYFLNNSSFKQGLHFAYSVRLQIYVNLVYLLYNSLCPFVYPILFVFFFFFSFFILFSMYRADYQYYNIIKVYLGCISSLSCGLSLATEQFLRQSNRHLWSICETLMLSVD